MHYVQGNYVHKKLFSVGNNTTLNNSYNEKSFEESEIMF